MESLLPRPRLVQPLVKGGAGRHCNPTGAEWAEVACDCGTERTALRAGVGSAVIIDGLETDNGLTDTLHNEARPGKVILITLSV